MIKKRKKIYGLKRQNEARVKVRDSLRNVAESIVSRSTLGGYLGQSYWSSDGSGAKRDIYKALGYKKNLVFDDYLAKYTRNELASTLIEAPVEQTWKLKPRIVDQKKGEKSVFEKDWNVILKEHKVWHYLSRADRISGIGRYGILFLGLDDGLNPKEEAKKAKKLLYLRPYSEGSLSIQEWENNPKSENYGKPKIYKVTVSSNQGSKATQTMEVHCSRVIHIAEGLLDDDIYGTPRLKTVFNRLQNIELVSGGSAEMFWRGAYPGYGFKAEEGATFDEDALDDLEDEIQDYLHELRRYMRLQGIEIEELAPQIASPKDHFDILITLVAAGKKIPKRILLGSERGELASNQDERAWLDRMAVRRLDFAEPIILRPFIDKLIKFGIIRPPTDNKYEIEWVPYYSLDPKDEAQVKKDMMEVVVKYKSTPGIEELLPPEFFLRKWLGLSQDDIDEIERLLMETEKYSREEEDDLENGVVCECLNPECGKVVKLEEGEHCATTPCPECGGIMRRKSRPGQGQE